MTQTKKGKTTAPKKKGKGKKKKSSSFGLKRYIAFSLAGIILFFAYQFFYNREPGKPAIPTVHTREKQKEVAASYLDLEIPKLATKRKDSMIRRIGYSVSYNKARRLPNWIGYELTRAETRGNENRTDNFLVDPDWKNSSATNKDYLRSGYDKGHMAPAADMKWSAAAMKESFYFSNICPQHPELNRRRWKELEEKIRDWAVTDSAVVIVCGPVIWPDEETKSIGANQVTVPHGFFKVILSPYASPPRAIGFIFRNEAASEPLRKYVVTVDSVEAVTDMDFFSPLPDEIENKIESQFDFSHWGL